MERNFKYRKYIEANLKWCIGDGSKVCFFDILLGLYGAFYFFCGWK